MFQKQKREKKTREELSFITQFKTEFLLRFTGCRKVLGKMPDVCMHIYAHNNDINKSIIRLLS